MEKRVGGSPNSMTINSAGKSLRTPALEFCLHFFRLFYFKFKQFDIFHFLSFKFQFFLNCEIDPPNALFWDQLADVLYGLGKK